MGDEAGRSFPGSRYMRHALVAPDVEADLNKRLFDTESRETKLQAMLAIERKRVHEERQKCESKEEEISRLLEELSASNQDGLEAQKKLDETMFKLHISDNHRQDLETIIAESLDSNRRILESAFGTDVTSRGDVGLTLATINETRAGGSRRKVIVDAMAEDGPAVTSGKIRIGDTISTIRGLDTSQLRPDEMATLMEGPHGTPVTFTGTRGKTQINFAITLIRSNGCGTLREQSEDVCEQIDRMKRELDRKKAIIFFERKARDILLPWRVWANNKKRIMVSGIHVQRKHRINQLALFFDGLKFETIHGKRTRVGTQRMQFRGALKAAHHCFMLLLQNSSQKRSLRNIENIIRRQHRTRFLRSSMATVICEWMAICREREGRQASQMFVSKRRVKSWMRAAFELWDGTRRRSQQRSRLSGVLAGAIRRHWLSNSLRTWRSVQGREKLLAASYKQVSHGAAARIAHASFSAWIEALYDKHRTSSLSVVIARSANHRRSRVILRAWLGMAHLLAHSRLQVRSAAFGGWAARAAEIRHQMMLYTAISRIALRHRARAVVRAWTIAAVGTQEMQRAARGLALRQAEGAGAQCLRGWRAVALMQRLLIRAFRAVAARTRRRELVLAVEAWVGAIRGGIAQRRGVQRLRSRELRSVAGAACGGWAAALAADRRRGLLCGMRRRGLRLQTLGVAVEVWVEGVREARRVRHVEGRVRAGASRGRRGACWDRWLEFVAEQRQWRWARGKVLTHARKRMLGAALATWDMERWRSRQLLRVTDCLLRAQKWQWTGWLFRRWEASQRAAAFERWRLGEVAGRRRRAVEGGAFRTWVGIYGEQLALWRAEAGAVRAVRRHRLGQLLREWAAGALRRRQLAHSAGAVRRMVAAGAVGEALALWRVEVAQTRQQVRSQSSKCRAERRLGAQALCGWRREAERRVRTAGLAAGLRMAGARRRVAVAAAGWVEVWRRKRQLGVAAARVRTRAERLVVLRQWRVWQAGASEQGRRRAMLRGAEKRGARLRAGRAVREWRSEGRRGAYMGWGAASIESKRRRRALGEAVWVWQTGATRVRRVRRVSGMVLGAAVRFWVATAFRWWVTLWRRADRERLSVASVALFREQEGKALEQAFRGWVSTARREEQLQWSYTASCRALRRSAAAAAFAEWAAAAQAARRHLRRLSALSSSSARRCLARYVAQWAEEKVAGKQRRRAGRAVERAVRRGLVARFWRGWVAIGRRGDRIRGVWQLETLAAAHVRYGAQAAVREWAGRAREEAQLRLMDQEFEADNVIRQLSTALRGWAGWTRGVKLLEWAHKGVTLRMRRFRLAVAFREWRAESAREAAVTAGLAALARAAVHRWASTTLLRMMVFLAGGMDAAAAHAANRAQVVAHQTSAALHASSRQRVRRVFGNWEVAARGQRARRCMEESMGRLAERRRLGKAVGGWRDLCREGRELAQLASQAARCRWQATVARWLLAWVGVVKRSREVLDVGEELAGRQLMAVMAGAFLRWRRCALWEAWSAGEEMEETLGDAVWECIGERVRPSDAHEWAAKALWGTDGGGAEALCASDLVVKVKVGVAKTVGRWFGDELLTALGRVHQTEDAVLGLGGGVMALKAEHAREVEAMAGRLMELESVLLALLATAGPDLSTDPSHGRSPSLSRFRHSVALDAVPGVTTTYSHRSSPDDVGEGDKGVGIGVLLDKVAGAEDVLVKGLVAGGLASRTGLIRQNDVLEAVNGERVRGLGLGAIYRRMQGREGSPLFLQLARRGCSHLLNAPVRFQVSFVRSSLSPPAVVVGQA